MLKNLRQFERFDCVAFFAGKKLMVVSCLPLKDYDTGMHLGTKAELAITEDNTVYKPNKDGIVSKNLFEKLTVKVSKDIALPEGAIVELVNPVGTVYGDYRNQLSIRADDVKVIQQK